MRYQADFNNERRWLGWDLLSGRVQPGHPLRAHLLAHGATAAELDSLADKLSPPDIIGINHYVTSDRFLDEQIENYQERTHGRNGFEVYADEVAVRAAEVGCGFERAIREAHERYRRPIALTEVHLAAAPEEQLRWLMAAWEAATTARAEGIEVRALTAWSLLGAFDWDSLVTQPNEHYEAGVFDLSDGQVRTTILGEALRALSRGEAFEHPALAESGWWCRLREAEAVSEKVPALV